MIETGELPIFVKWLDMNSWILATAEKFPKKVRGTFSDRIVNLTLDVVEEFTEARYSKTKLPILKRINRKLEVIRIILRIAHDQKILSHQSYKHGCHLINEVGQMLGGWIKHQQGGEQ